MRTAQAFALLLLLTASSVVGVVACGATSGSETQATASSPRAQPPTTPAAPAAALAVAEPHSPQVELAPPGEDPVSVAVEVVSTPDGRQRGLMFRKQMAAEAGMLFLFPEPRQQTFWMHNTLIPLDMVFIAADKSVLGVVENATPQTDAPRSVPGQSQYVLEVNAGWSRRHNVSAGTNVRFVDISETGVE